MTDVMKIPLGTEWRIRVKRDCYSLHGSLGRMRILSALANYYGGVRVFLPETNTRRSRLCIIAQKRINVLQNVRLHNSIWTVYFKTKPCLRSLRGTDHAEYYASPS